MNPRLYSFVGGTCGSWAVVEAKAIAGEALPLVERIEVVAGETDLTEGARWLLRGATSNTRYTTAAEKKQLVEIQADLGRPEATCAALIPIRKSAAWWDLPQDQRRGILEETSHHIQIGLKYLPAIARRLHHCRDLGTAEPFDFLTWFDYSPADAGAFDELVGELRATAEWKFVEHEVDIRLTR